MADEELTPEEQFAAEPPEVWVPRDLAKGRSKWDIIDELLRLGWTYTETLALVQRSAADLARYASSPESRATLVREAFLQMALWFLVSAVGLGQVIWSVLDESPNTLPGGIGIIMIIVGLIRGSRGYYRWRAFRYDDLTSE